MIAGWPKSQICIAGVAMLALFAACSALAQEATPSPGEVWQTRIDERIDQISQFEVLARDADELFLELDDALHMRLGQLNANLAGARSPLQPISSPAGLPEHIQTLDDLHTSVELMYAGRLRLLEHLTPTLRLEATATDVYGVRQLALEATYVWQHIRFQTLSFPAASEKLWRRIQIAPLPVLWRFLEFIIAIAVFRWWRRWAPETLRRMRSSLTEIRPRSTAVLRRIKAIWYFDQVRAPLEWMVLSQVIFTLINMPGLNFLVEIIDVVVRWVLLGWLSVSLLNAVAARGDAGLTGEDARLRLSSLRLVVTWLVLLGLGLALAESLAGIATLHAWVWRLFQLLALPVLLVLLSWWRKPIFDRIEREHDNKDVSTELLRYRKGPRSYSRAANGAFWLLANNLRRATMRGVLRFGNDPVSSAGLGGSASSGTVNSADDTERSPLPESARARLLSCTEFYEKYARTEQRRLLQLARMEQSGIVAITGERGIGKSILLARVKDQLCDSAILLDCNNASYADLEADLCRALAVDTPDPKKVADALIDSATRFIGIDNLHRLARPIIGGQTELVRLIRFVEQIRSDILWVISADCYAWQYVRRVRTDWSTMSETIDLRAWTAEQVFELLDQRTAESGLEPNFDDVHVPSEFVETTQETAAERNKASVYRMISDVSGGNPAVALRLWADSLFLDEQQQLRVGTPVQMPSRELEAANPNVLLVLRAIAQSERITGEDVADNLRLPQGEVSSAIHFCLLRGWIEEIDGQCQLTWRWFRTINRALARQNLLAR